MHPGMGTLKVLEPGTPVYALSAYAPGFRLAVKEGQGVVFYQVSRNPRARRGTDVLDIRREGRMYRYPSSRRSFRSGVYS